MLSEFNKMLVLVMGDLMVDKYITGVVERISPEAPIPVLQQQQVIRKLGGTGNVILNIISLGGKVRAIGRIGQDEEGETLRHTLKSCGVEDEYVFSEGTTIVKTRVTASHQQFIRIDEEKILPPSGKITQKIIHDIPRMMDNVAVVIISDYAKGFITEELAQAVISEARRRGVPVLVDPKGKSAAKYRGATALTPNNKEFMDMTGITRLPDEEGIREKGVELSQKNDLDMVIFTRAEKGISVITAKGEKRDYPAVIQEVVDVTGAGDTVVSMLAMGIGAGLELSTCVKLANLAASIVISRFGAAQTTVEAIERAMSPGQKTLLSREEIIEEIHQLKSAGKHIVFTNGCFDLVHAGHVKTFRKARSFGDVLIVGVNSDESIRRIKGPSRPIVSLENRMYLLNALSCVDYIIPFDEDTPQKLIEQIRPDVLVKGGDWAGQSIAGGDFVRSYGGRVEFVDLKQGLSTTSIIEKIKSAEG